MQIEAVEDPNYAVAPAAQEGAFLRGTVIRITYRSQESGFTIFKASPDPGTQDSHALDPTIATVVGLVGPSFEAGSSFVARGEWQTHPKFGRQFKARAITETEPTGKEAIVRYLSSGVVKGFGPVLAERVVERFGDHTLKIIDETPKRLLEVPGIGEKKLEEIHSAWVEKRNMREVLLFFQNHGISLSLATRIYNAYGDRAIEVVSRDPYILAREVWRIGFVTADRVGLALGLDPASRERVSGGLNYTLQQAADDGNCFLPKDELFGRAARLLGLEQGDIFEEALSHSILGGDVIEEDGELYLPLLHLAERELARELAERLLHGAPRLTPISESVIRATLEQPQLTQAASAGADSPSVIRLSPQQEEAIRLAANNPLLVVTGGPGCGKTTVIRTIAALFRRAGLETRLAAPTGRAAQRLAEVCGCPASTIHRLLGFDPVQRGFVHTSERKLELDALIVDESSMIDLPLAANLLKALPSHARVVFVGDADQLPSVGPGLFLADLLAVDELPRMRLTTLFRRAEESMITTVAHEINRGETPIIPQPGGGPKRDAYFLPAQSTEEAAALVERLVVEQLPRKFGFSQDDITVLSPVNQGELGIIALNQRLQQRLVPRMPGMKTVRVNNLELRHGDRVCQRVNNYQLHANGVFNGDQGRVTGVDPEGQRVYVQLWDGREIEYDSDSLTQLDLAYALTIHRSQGSEVPAVVLLLHDSHHIMLERQLLYTAVTRAKRLLVLVGTQRALSLAVSRTRSKRRHTQLANRVVRLLNVGDSF